MYAIMDFMGGQYRIEKDAVIKVPYIASSVAGSELKIERILMLNTDSNVVFGHPTIESAHATAEVLGHGREKKIVVFKKKRRKGYRKTQGHRQDFTQIKIREIVV